LGTKLAAPAALIKSNKLTIIKTIIKNSYILSLVQYVKKQGINLIPNKKKQYLGEKK